MKKNAYRVTLMAAIVLLTGNSAQAQWVGDFGPPHIDNPLNSAGCLGCHIMEPFGYGLKPVPRGAEQEVFCKTCHNPTGVASAKSDVGNHVVQHGGASMTIDCSTCHDPHIAQSSTDPHTGTKADNLSLIRSLIDATRVAGVLNPVVFQQRPAHFAFNEGNSPYDGACQACHTETSHHTNNTAADHAHQAGSTCTTCHAHEGGFLPTSGACDSCHGAPPATGAHTKHFGGTLNQVSYGGTATLSTPTEYIFQCGTCHPLSASNHMNGTVDVELYNVTAPAGSLKALNPPTASYSKGATSYPDPNGINYTLGTCSNIYCHSKTDWSSPDPISLPLADGFGNPIVDANGNLTYQPYTVTETKVYATVSWGGTSLGCNDCHRNPPQTAYPAVQAGVGNTHAWIDNWGYENLHAFNMSFNPLICRSCHYNTVTDSMTWTRNTMDVTTYDDVPIANKAFHVNGTKDVAFDPVNQVTYTNTFSLAATTYDPANKTCSSVPCHLQQKKPQWGKPYRWDFGSIECDQCHRYGYTWPPSPSQQGPALSRSLTGLSPVLADMPHTYTGKCINCHDVHR